MARVRFGLFEFDPETGELRRDGRPVHLQAQPARALALLVSAQGAVVTREAFRKALWSDGTFVDVDRSLNFAIAHVRTALGDSTESPTFIRTLPKCGYQFIAPVSIQQAASPSGEPPAAAPPPTDEARRPRRQVAWWLAAFAALTAAIIVAFLTFREPRVDGTRVAVARFQNETGDPALDRLADTITDSVVAELTSRTAGSYGIIGNAAILRRARTFQDIDEIASTLQTRYLIGQVQNDGARVRILAHLIRLPDKTHLHVSRVEVSQPVFESQLAQTIVDDLTPRLDSPAAATN